MNIEEARKVLWLKSNPRPVGELLDEGCLTKENLEWASQWAYNSKLKQAAQVLLDSINSSPSTARTEGKVKASDAIEKEIGIEVGISLDEARSTLWPFSSHKDQPMGSLIDSKRLTLKDLGFAIETAWNPRVRQAAIALVLVKLNQVIKEPTSSVGFVNVISGGRSYSQRRESFLTLIQGMIFGLLIAFMIYMIVLSFGNAGKANPDAKSLAEVVSTPAGVFALVFVLGVTIFMGWLINFVTDRITKRLDKQIDEYRHGQDGEDNVVQTIVQVLDGSWHLFRNVQIPGRNKGDLDLVLVGPSGVWALEVKNFSGEYRNIGESWEYKHGKNWKNYRKSPSRQASNNAYRLKNFLKADGLNTFVNAVVVWANTESSLSAENPSTAIWRFNRLADELGNIWQGEKLSKSEQQKIVEKLAKLCERQKEKRS